MNIKVRGRRWRLLFVPRATIPDDTLGYRDSPSKKNKRIVIVREQAELDLLDTTIHELLHAAYPDLSEEAVEDGATDIARVLHNLGATIKAPKDKLDD